MTHFETLLPEQMTPLLPDSAIATEKEISLLEIAALLLRHKKFISATTLLVTGAAAIALYFLPPSYKAEATILPPQQQQSSLAMLASGALSGLAGSSMASQLGLKNPADLYIGILKSRTIADDIVNQFHLNQVYRTKLGSQAREALSSHAAFTSGKDSLIFISTRDHDPYRAAAIANAFVDELYKQNSRLAITDASQRRLFFEQQLAREKDALANAEIAMKQTQQTTGVIVPGGQAEVLIRSGAQLRAEIASREVELQATRLYATDENPRLQVLKREISALQTQLAQLEASGAGSKFELSAGRFPETSLEYVRKLRDLKYHETLFELIAKQYEISRIGEAEQSPVIQVVDRAVVADKDSRPRVELFILSILAGLTLSSSSIVLMDRIRKIRSDLKRRDDAAAFRSPLQSRS